MHGWRDEITKRIVLFLSCHTQNPEPEHTNDVFDNTNGTTRECEQLKYDLYLTYDLLCISTQHKTKPGGHH